MNLFVCDICGNQDVHPFFVIEFKSTDGEVFGKYVTCGIMRGPSGRWLPTIQAEGVPVCVRCGMSAVLYRESA